MSLYYPFRECYSIHSRTARAVHYVFPEEEINMALSGYADKVAWVDLNTGKTEFKPIPEEYKIKYIGARGVGDRFVFDNGPSVDPL